MRRNKFCSLYGCRDLYGPPNNVFTTPPGINIDFESTKLLMSFDTQPIISNLKDNLLVLRINNCIVFIRLPITSNIQMDGYRTHGSTGALFLFLSDLNFSMHLISETRIPRHNAKSSYL